MTEPTPAEGACAKWVLSSGGVTVEVTATIVGSNVVFNYALVSGVADLNGFFIDVGNDGGSITKVGTNSNNMNGSDTDGDRLNGFDYAAVLGTVGGNDADNTSGTVTVSLSALKITSLDQLADAEIGIRATSVGANRDGSLKMATTGEVCLPEEPDLCDRPIDGENVDGRIAQSANQITSLTLTFFDNLAHQAGLPTPGDTSGDGYYTVQINVPAEMGEDPDAYLDSLLDLLTAQDSFVLEPYGDQDFYFKSVIVTDCHGDMLNYAIETDTNGEATDPMAGGMFNDPDSILDETTDVAGHVDMVYDLAISGDSFAFV